MSIELSRVLAYVLRVIIQLYYTTPIIQQINLKNAHALIPEGFGRGILFQKVLSFNQFILLIN